MLYKNFKIFFFLISLAGVLFSGYMSAVKMFSHVCAFGETCPLFLGLPACYFGFAFFLTLFILSLIFAAGKHSNRVMSSWLFFVSLLGVIFSGYFAIEELPLFFKFGFGAYTFGLPTCVLGFLFFAAFFIGSIVFKLKSKKA